MKLNAGFRQEQYAVLLALWYRPEDEEEQMNQTEREVDRESLGEPKGEWGRLKSIPKRRTSWETKKLF